MSSVFFRGRDDIRSAEIFFLKKTASFVSRVLGKKFNGICVSGSKKLDARELAPVEKILSIRDIFQGAVNLKTLPLVGLRLDVGGKTVDALINTDECWAQLCDNHDQPTMPLDRHVSYVLKEIFSLIERCLPSSVEREKLISGKNQTSPYLISEKLCTP